MKSYIIIFSLLLLAASLCSMAPMDADQICGKWLNEEQNSQIEIYKKGDQYFGKIVWVKEAKDPAGKPNTDQKNPEASLRDRPILGLEIIKDLTFAKGKWINGTLYAQQAGLTMDCSLSLNADDELEISVRKSFFSNTKVWTRL